MVNASFTVAVGEAESGGVPPDEACTEAAMFAIFAFEAWAVRLETMTLVASARKLRRAADSSSVRDPLGEMGRVSGYVLACARGGRWGNGKSLAGRHRTGVDGVLL